MDKMTSISQPTELKLKVPFGPLAYKGSGTQKVTHRGILDSASLYLGQGVWVSHRSLLL